jgi:hypothetical protein
VTAVELLPFTVQDIQMLQLLKPHLSLRGRDLVDGLLALAFLTNEEVRKNLSPLPALQLLNFFQTRSELKAEARARALAASSAEEGRLMSKMPIDAKDVSLMLAIKPFLTPKSQTLVDALVNFLAVLSSPPERKVDPEALANLINLIAQESDTPKEEKKPEIKPPALDPFPVYSQESLTTVETKAPDS